MTGELMAKKVESHDISTPPPARSHLETPPGLSATEYPAPTSSPPTKKEERSISQRNLENARENMLFLFGREIGVSPLSEAVPAGGGLALKEELPQGGVEGEVEGSAAGSSTIQSKPRPWEVVDFRWRRNQVQSEPWGSFPHG